MDLRRLRTFVAVAELGTVSKAAVRLRIGQPALSRQIAELQKELGIRLFDHVGRGLVLTAEGERYRAVHLPRVRAFPGVRAVFTAIKALGARIALATDCQSDELKRYRGLMNVDDMIDAVACGDEVSKGKPDPALIELALGHLGGISAASATMIGDTPFDAQAARRAGATAWGTLTGGHPRSSLIDAGCSVVVPAVEDLQRYIERGTPGVSASAPR